MKLSCTIGIADSIPNSKRYHHSNDLEVVPDVTLLDCGP